MTALPALTSSLAALCLIGPASTAWAEGISAERHKLLMSGDNSRFSAPVTILQDHPRCNAPGEVAFATKIDAENMDLVISSNTWRKAIKQYNFHGDPDARQTCLAKGRYLEMPDKARCADNPADEDVKVVDDRTCYRKERRGTELMRISVACGDDTPEPSINQRILDAEIRLDVVASAQLCQSLTGLALMQSHWTATFTAGGITETLKGTLGADPQSGATGPTTFRTGLSLARRSYRLQTASKEFADGPFQLDPMRSAAFKLRVEVKDLNLPGLPKRPATLWAERGFRLDLQ